MPTSSHAKDDQLETYMYNIRENWTRKRTIQPNEKIIKNETYEHCAFAYNLRHGFPELGGHARLVKAAGEFSLRHVVAIRGVTLSADMFCACYDVTVVCRRCGRWRCLWTLNATMYGWAGGEFAKSRVSFSSGAEPLTVRCVCNEDGCVWECRFVCESVVDELCEVYANWGVLHRWRPISPRVAHYLRTLPSATRRCCRHGALEDRCGHHTETREHTLKHTHYLLCTRMHTNRELGISNTQLQNSLFYPF